MPVSPNFLQKALKTKTNNIDHFNFVWFDFYLCPDWTLMAVATVLLVSFAFFVLLFFRGTQCISPPFPPLATPQHIHVQVSSSFQTDWKLKITMILGTAFFFSSFQFHMSPLVLPCSPQHQGTTETRHKAQISAVMMVTVTKVFHNSFTPSSYDQTLPETSAWQQIS